MDIMSIGPNESSHLHPYLSQLDHKLAGTHKIIWKKINLSAL